MDVFRGNALLFVLIERRSITLRTAPRVRRRPHPVPDRSLRRDRRNEGRRRARRTSKILQDEHCILDETTNRTWKVENVENLETHEPGVTKLGKAPVPPDVRSTYIRLEFRKPNARIIRKVVRAVARRIRRNRQGPSIYTYDKQHTYCTAMYVYINYNVRVNAMRRAVPPADQRWPSEFAFFTRCFYYRALLSVVVTNAIVPRASIYTC
jgi:hypothetical protein